MVFGAVTLSVVLVAAELSGGAEAPTAPAPTVEMPRPGQRQRRGTGPEKRGIHELEDPSYWPPEPPVEKGPLDAARFDAAVEKVCGEVAPDAVTPGVARVVREVSAETGADPFLIAALAYRGSRCRPSANGASGVGLLGIEPSMFAPGAPLPFPRADLDREALLDPAHNLRVGIALLKMWEADHLAIDRALGSTPHRTALAHFFWGDRVWGTTAEDRTLTARRRLLEAYENAPLEFKPSSLGLTIVSPLEGGERLGTSGLGADRDDGARAHRGLDIDATIGEPVRAVADGVVQFAGVDLTGDRPALGLLPRQVRRWHRYPMGPGGFFVRIMHADGIRSGYFHLTGFRVVAGQAVHAGEVIGTVGRSGVKVSGSHLHFEVHRDGELQDPVPFLAAFVLPPDRTITNRIAMTEKRQRLARLAHQRRQARRAALHRVG
ncbi:MAG TPA: M23 family metallopeptidase [Polyangia bacterium]|nr:M23 family metallopeptidase [Polyangia bacterium]